MPYPRWLETCRRHPDLPAIFEVGSVVTFADLAAALALQPRAEAPVIARTGGMDFFVQILRAWRDDQPAIPLELGAPDPLLASAPPPGTCLVKYTPGATGIPRGIFLTAAQIAADCDRLADAMGLTPATVNLAAISAAHSYGFSNIVLPLLLRGVPVHFAPVPFPRAVEEIFRSHAAISVPAVPSMWRAWHRAGILKGAPIRLALSAGAPLGLALEREIFTSAGLKIRNFYGASECGGISLDGRDSPREAETDVGTPLPGVEIQLGADGRIGVRSDAVATGYDRPRDDDSLGGGFYRTRDIGEIDPAGRLHLNGTLGGAINVAGRKVSPAKVEAALLAIGLVRRIAIRAVPSADPERFQEIAADFELKETATLTALKSAAAQTLQSWEMPRHWNVL